MASPTPVAPRFAGLARNVNATCQSCPSFAPEYKQTTTIGHPITGPVCLKKLIPIGRPGVIPQDKAGKDIASKCDKFGRPIQIADSARESAPEYVVAFPEIVTEPEFQPERVHDCTDCKFYAGPRATETKTGWEGGFCRAKGALILTDRLEKYAAGCSEKSYTDWNPLSVSYPAQSEVDAWPFQSLPEYTAKVAANSPVAILKASKEGRVDPREYPTDKPISPKAESLGIRAWRRIRDQAEFGPDVFLPIFDLHKINAEKLSGNWNMEIELSKVPQAGDPEKPERYIDHNNFVYRVVVMWTRLEQTPALWGPAGVGKTELFRYMAYLMQLPFERISITGSSELDDLAGKMMYSPERGTFWQNGRIPKAWAKPNILCIDEPNVGPPDVWQFLRPLTDNSKQLVLDQNKGERITAHDAAYLGMAMNPAWDPRNVGAMELGDADGSRLMHIHMGLPPYEVETAIILENLLDDRPKKMDPADAAEEDKRDAETVKTLMKVAKDLRALSEERTIPISWGIRNQIKVARLRKYMRWADAFRAGVVDSLEPIQGEAIMTAVRSHCPEE